MEDCDKNHDAKLKGRGLLTVGAELAVGPEEVVVEFLESGDLGANADRGAVYQVLFHPLSAVQHYQLCPANQRQCSHILHINSTALPTRNTDILSTTSSALPTQHGVPTLRYR